MRRVVLAFLAIGLFAGCNAASIETNESVAAGTVWSFSVNLPDAEDFDDAKVFLDGDRTISFYTYNGKIKFDQDDVDKSRVFSVTEPIDNTVYFLVSPLERGDHEIGLEVDGETEDEEQVNFFEIYDAEGRADLQSQINSLRGSVNSVVEQFNDFGEKTLSEQDRAELEAKIAQVESLISSLEQDVENRSLENAQKVDVLLKDVTSLQQRTFDMNKSFGIGLFSVGAVSQDVQTAVIVLIIVVVAAVLVAKYRDRIPLKKGLYGKPKKGQDLFSRQDKEITEQVLNESQDEEQKGKWAFGEKEEKQHQRKGFNIGDLIRK